MTHAELVQIGKRWLLRNGCPYAITEVATAASESPDIIGFRYGKSVLIEVKVSRSDFLADRKKHFREYPEMGMGNYRYYLAPKGLLQQREMPFKWVLLECSSNERISAKIKPHLMSGEKGHVYWFESYQHAERQLLLSVVRRLAGRLGDIDEILHSKELKNVN